MPALDLSDLALLLAGAVVASGGFLVRRVITRAKDHERVALFAGLTDISAKMKQHGLSPEDVNAVAAFVSSKRRETTLLQKASAHPTPTLEEHEEPDGYWSQASMNQRAGAAFNTASAQLDEALLELAHYVDADELERVQSAWIQFRDQQADFAGAQYAGGSIAPLIRASEAEQVTQQRLAWVRAELAERRSR